MRRGGAGGGCPSMRSSMIAWSSIGRNDHSSGELPRQRPLLQPRNYGVGNARPGPAVAEGEAGIAHRGPRRWIAEQPRGLSDDPLAIRADKSRGTCGDALRPLGLVAEDEQRNDERRRLFLDAPRIAQHQVGVAHATKQLFVAAWVDQQNSADAAKQPAHA